MAGVREFCVHEPRSGGAVAARPLPGDHSCCYRIQPGSCPGCHAVPAWAKIRGCSSREPPPGPFRAQIDAATANLRTMLRAACGGSTRRNGAPCCRLVGASPARWHKPTSRTPVQDGIRQGPRRSGTLRRPVDRARRNSGLNCGTKVRWRPMRPSLTVTNSGSSRPRRCRVRLAAVQLCPTRR